MSFYRKLSWYHGRVYELYRIWLLKIAGCTVGKNVRIFGRFTWVGDGCNLVIGDESRINEGVHLNARTRITIGRHVHLSAGSQVHTGSLDISKAGIRHHVSSPITIEDYAWIGCGAVLTQGIVVGKNSVVGANSVVTRDVPPDTLVAGAPAKIVRKLIYENQEVE